MKPKKLHIAGVDEVGKGALFGPVFAGAVLLNESTKKTLLNLGLKDSKLLSAKKRAFLVPLIKKYSSYWSLGQASSSEIDMYGIRHATELAMLRAIQRFPIVIDLVLVDGILPLRLWKGSQKTLVRGEKYSPEIAAASVLAKEARDALIKRLSKSFPKYGLEKHVGYGTQLHRNALLSSGPTRLHRNSFLKKILLS